jgi:hypothetical protein
MVGKMVVEVEDVEFAGIVKFVVFAFLFEEYSLQNSESYSLYRDFLILFSS